MPVIDNPADFHLAHDGRPPIISGDVRRQWGAPFRIPVTITNAGAMAVNLTQKGTWYGDRRVRAAYAIGASSDTAPMDATIRIEAVRLSFTADLSLVSGANKAKLFAQATEPYLYGLVQGMPWYSRVSFNELLTPLQVIDTDLIVTTGYVKLASSPKLLDDAVTVYLKDGSLLFQSDAAVAMGADYTADLEIFGSIHPGDESSQHPGGTACSFSPQGGEASTGQVKSARLAYGTSLQHFAVR